jgi:hypothetical protein
MSTISDSAKDKYTKATLYRAACERDVRQAKRAIASEKANDNDPGWLGRLQWTLEARERALADAKIKENDAWMVAWGDEASA